MRASEIQQKFAASLEGIKAACQILILHEDYSAYSRAVEVCRRVMDQFANELDFDIKCWSSIELADFSCARHAAKTAATADIVLLSMSTGHLPVQIERWLDSFFATRFRADGLLALLLNPLDSAPLEAKKLSQRLEQLTERLGMDFLVLHPDNDALVVDLLPAITLPPEARK
jgi:hypothetical protein